MTPEQKAKAYDEALEKAKQIIVEYDYDEHDNVFMEIFPELKESEDVDKKIREEIIATIHLYYGKPLEDEAKEMIAWLEKQGEQKPIKMWHDISEVPDEMQELLVEWESPDATWHDIAFYDTETKAFRHLKQPINNVTRWAYVSDILSQSVTKTSEQGWGDALERQGEQKPSDEDMKEALRTEYEKGRADVLRCIDPDVMVADFCSQPLSKTRSLASIYRQGIIDIVKRIDNNEETSITSTRSIDDGGVHRA